MPETINFCTGFQSRLLLVKNQARIPSISNRRIRKRSRCGSPLKYIFYKKRTQTFAHLRVQLGSFWRRQRDSNPRGLSPKRFSRPPRYDRFDIPPKLYQFIIFRKNRQANRSVSLSTEIFVDVQIALPAAGRIRRTMRRVGEMPLRARFTGGLSACLRKQRSRFR